jgi:hypothetical protein
VRLRWDEIITRLSYRFNFLAIRVADGIGPRPRALLRCRPRVNPAFAAVFSRVARTRPSIGSAILARITYDQYQFLRRF